MATIETTSLPPEHGSPLSLSDGGPTVVDEAAAAFRPEPCDPALSLRLVDELDLERWDEAERFIYDVFRVSEFCEESSRGWVEEIDRYRHGSTLHVISDPARPVGVVRTIPGTYDQLPIGAFPATVPLTAGPLVEIGSLAVRATLRGLGVANELHRSAVRCALLTGAEGFCMLVEPWAIDFYRDVDGVPRRQPAEARHYMGSLTVPAVAMLDEMVDNLVRTRRGVYQWFTEGLPVEVFTERGLPLVLD
ncbi:MAG: GNAT family N-acetyltransferase [Actinomycetes bacterium]